MMKRFLLVCRTKDNKEELVDQYFDEEFEWSRSNSSTDAASTGQFIRSDVGSAVE